MTAPVLPLEAPRLNPRRILGDTSVLIPTLGRQALLGCIRSLMEGSAWPAALIVVDQGDNERVSDWLTVVESYGVRVRHVRSTQRGAAAARNRGVECAATRYIAATDDDCTVAADWLERMHARLEAHPEAIVTGSVRKGVAERVGSYAPSVVRREREEIHRRPLFRRDPLCSGNMGFAVTLYERSGQMSEDQRLRFAEDAEWSYRALRAGIPIVYAPEVVVDHIAWRDRSSIANVYSAYAYSQGAFYGQYVRRGDWFIAGRAVRDLLCGPWWLLRGSLTRNTKLSAIGRAYVARLGPGLLAGLMRAGGEPNDDAGRRPRR